MDIILASKSPRRFELLSKLNIKFRVVPSLKDEVLLPNLTIEEQIKNIAYNKGKEVLDKNVNSLVIGADTVVVIDDIILGKPKDYDDAVRMIELLENKTHKVITGVCILTNNKEVLFHETSYVTFKKMTIEEIKEYCLIKDIYDKAGAYAIQGDAKKYILKLDGDYDNVVGLPITRLKKELEDFLK